MIKRWLMAVLRILAILTIRKHAPFVIGITGSVGKTSTKEAVYAVVRDVRRTRASPASFNNEIGFPLAILGNWDRVGGTLFWCKVLWSGFFGLFLRREYPEVLVLEYGADKPGDISYLLEIARPTIGIVTAVGETPAHVEFYPDPAAVAREKAHLIEALPAHGFAILNGDDEYAVNMKGGTRARVVTFGFREDAEVRVTNFEMHMGDGRPAGIAFKLAYGGSFVPVRLNNCFGKPQAYAAAAAGGAGIAMAMNLVKIAEALSYYQSPPHRMWILPAAKGATMIDDSYNASPSSMEAALETLKAIPAPRKIGVLGDMLEIGKYAVGAHEAVGRAVAEILDVLITVGPRAKLIADAAARKGFSKKNIRSFDTVDEAVQALPDLIRRGDLVLIKASHAMQFERLAEVLRQK